MKPSSTRYVFVCLVTAWTCFATSSTAAENDGEQRLPDLVAKISPSIVTVLVYLDGDDRFDRQGTGWFRSADELVTNRHVVAKALRAVVRFADGRTATIRGVLADDPRSDLAILSVSVVPAPEPIPVATRQPRAGERVFVVGTPLGLERTVSEGIISSIRSANGINVMQTTAAISPGSSGSPLIDMSGQVLGVATAQITGGQLLNFAVSVDAVSALKAGPHRDLAEWSGTVEGPTLERQIGIDMAAIERVLASSYGVPPNPSVSRMKLEEYMARINLLHPSFAPSFEGLDQAIRHGVGQAKREYGKVFGKYSRKAGDDLVTPYFPSRLAVYEGWSEARKYRPIPNAKETFPLPSHHLQFFVQMSRKNRTKELIMPSFALKISQDTYIQPAGEPKAEDLQSRTYSRSGIRSYYNYFTKRTEYYAYTNSDTYFSTAYMVTFDLFSSDGTPILKPDDEEVILVLVLQGEEKRVKFKLSDWTINRVTRGKE